MTSIFPANNPDCVKTVALSAVSKVIPTGEQLSDRLRVVLWPTQCISIQFSIVQLRFRVPLLLMWSAILCMALQVVPLTDEIREVLAVGCELVSSGTGSGVDSVVVGSMVG